MEAEATITTGAEAPVGTGEGLDVTESFLSGASTESVAAQVNPPEPETTETPAAAEAAPQQAAQEPAAETKPEESADQTAEQFAEPLPQKIEDLLKAVRQSNPKLASDLNKIVREDHFLLHGPTGFLAAFPGGVQEAAEYKAVAPTVEDLKVMAEYASRYDGLDRQYIENPAAMIQTLAEDRQAFSGVARAIEPALRGDPEMYQEAARPFNENFVRNLTDLVRANGTPEEQELFAAIVQKFGLSGGNGNAQRVSQFAQTPEFRELEALRAEKAARQGESRNLFFQDVNREVTPTLKGEIRKYLEEKVGSGLPEDLRGELLDEMAGSVSLSIWKELNGNPIIASELGRTIAGGDLSQAHRQQVIDRVLTRGRAFFAQKSAPEISRTLGRLRKLQGGNTNATKPTAQTGASKDVGAGAGTGVPAGAPKGFPQGWNVMNAQQRANSLAPLVNWAAMDAATGDRADEVFNAVCAGYEPPSKVVLKAR